MKTQKPAIEIRAGIISALVLALGYLWINGMSDAFQVWGFIVSFAVCFVLMVQSIIDLLVATFTIAASASGRLTGYSVRMVRHLLANLSRAGFRS